MGDFRLIDPEGGPAELHDVTADPQERDDRAEELPEVVAELLQTLDQILKSTPQYPRAKRVPEAPSETMLEHLRGIGRAGDD